MSSHARLIELIKEKSLRFGDFTLTSGKKASYYLDGKQLTLDSEGSLLVANAILEIAENEKIDCVGGMTLGADPMVGSVLTAAGFKGVPLQGFIVRKEAKQHGTEKWIEGILTKDARVLILEDVITTGGSVLRAIRRVEESGGHVIRTVCIVDRLEGGGPFLQKQGYPLIALTTIEELGVNVSEQR